MNALERIVASVREELTHRRATVDRSALAASAQRRLEAAEFRDFAGALGAPGLSVIAEHKRRSPSAGAIREDLSLPEVVAAYERGGAAAISVLTEPHSFGGSLTDLSHARQATRLPILRKDFIVEEIQLLEAAAHGADAVLLIVAALPAATLKDLHARAGELGLATLVEVHDAAELETALQLDAPIIGINNRDLTTLEVDTERTYALLELIPDGPLVIAESGFGSREQLDRLRDAGVDGVLIGEALMRSPELEAALRKLLAGERAPAPDRD